MKNTKKNPYQYDVPATNQILETAENSEFDRNKQLFDNLEALRSELDLNEIFFKNRYKWNSQKVSRANSILSLVFSLKWVRKMKVI